MYASFIVYTGCLNNNYPQQTMQHKQPKVSQIQHVRKILLELISKAISAGGDTLKNDGYQ